MLTKCSISFRTVNFYINVLVKLEIRVTSLNTQQSECPAVKLNAVGSILNFARQT